MSDKRTLGMYLAVLPSYRRECIDVLIASEPSIELFCADAHLNKSVRTGIDSNLYKRTRMVRIGKKAFAQIGHWRRALSLDDLVVDFNPRSCTAWLLLTVRRVARRRTVVWGHLHPRVDRPGGGRGRRLMRKLSDGMICYTYGQAAQARIELPAQPVWVAPNALYRSEQLTKNADPLIRSDVLYVGRLESEKRVDLFVRAFAVSGLASEGARAKIVGFGEERTNLERLVNAYGIKDSVEFLGRVESVEELSSIYAGAFCAVSPGFAGLGVTQSFGFGVPVIVNRHMDHSPEIELAEAWPAATYWSDDDDTSFAEAIRAAYQNRASLPARAVQNDIADRYSAERMARGLQDALRGRFDDWSHNA